MLSLSSKNRIKSKDASSSIAIYLMVLFTFSILNLIFLL